MSPAKKKKGDEELVDLLKELVAQPHDAVRRDNTVDLRVSGDTLEEALEVLAEHE